MTDKNQVPFILTEIAMMLGMYIAGRLNKVKQNGILMTLVLILLILSAILSPSHGRNPRFGNVVGQFNVAIAWFDIMFAYMLRFKEHKEAGLE